MKPIASLILLLFLSLQAFPQAATPERALGIRFYNSFRHTAVVEGQPTWQQTQRTWDLLQPSIGIFWGGKGRVVREIELSNLQLGTTRNIYQTRDSISGQLGSPEPQTQTVQSRLRLRAEAIAPIADKGESPFKLSLGFGAVFSFAHISGKALATTEFPFSSVHLGLQGSFTPRLTYWVSDRVALDLSMPLGLIAFSYDDLREPDPSLPLTGRYSQSFSYELFTRDYAIRLGLALRL